MPSLGKVGLVNKGDYSPSATYNILDFVYYDGSSYICLQNGTSAVTPNNEGLYWRYLAKGYIADTSVFCRKADMKTSLTTTYTAGQYAADASALKTLNDKIKTYTASSPIAISNENNISLTVSGAVNVTTAFGETGNKTPAFGGTFKVPSFTVDKWGRLTVAADHTVTVPAVTKSVVKAAFPDVEVGTITWKTNNITLSGDESTLQKVGNICILKLNFQCAQTFSDFVEIGSVPNGFKPRETFSYNASLNHVSGATWTPCIRVGGSGVIYLMNYEGPTGLGIRAVIPYFTA